MMNKKIKLSKDVVFKKSNTSKSRLINIVFFVLIFLLTVSTIITIQIRSDKKRVVQNSAKTSVLTVNDIKPQSQTIDTANQSITQVNQNEPKEVLSKQNFVLPFNSKITKGFSDTELVYSNTMDDWRIHCGIDIETYKNAEIVSMSSGKISDIIKDDIYGSTIVVDHIQAVVKYSNIDVYDNIVIGCDVVSGMPLGTVSNNPMCEINDNLHIHIEAYKNDVAINPLDLLN